MIIHSTFISQFVRFSRNCNNSEGVKARIFFKFNHLVSLGSYSTKLVNAFRIYMHATSRHKFNSKFTGICNIFSLISY